MYGMQINRWHAWVFLFSKAVGHCLPKTICTDFIGINVYIPKTAVGTQVVDTAHMVVVGVGDKDGVDLPKLLLQHLLTEIWSAVYEQTGVFCFEKSRRAKSFVTWVCACAYITETT